MANLTIRRLAAFVSATLVILTVLVTTVPTTYGFGVDGPGLAPSVMTPCPLTFNSSSVRSMIQNLSGTVSPAIQAVTSQRVSGLFSFVCNNVTALDLIHQWGAINTSLGIYGARDGGLEFANLSVNWVSSIAGVAYTHEEYWTLNLLAQTINGPFVSVLPTAFEYSSSTVSENWAGFDLWYGSNPGTLTVATADTKAVPMTTEGGEQTNPPYTGPEDSIAAVWVGLETALGASSGLLLQTGFTYDASNPSSGGCGGFSGSCDYGLWWELYPNSAYPHTGNPKAGQGDHLTEDVFAYGAGQYGTEIYDDTTGQVWSSGTQVSSWSPTYAAFIIEAPWYQSGSFVLPGQIPGFGSTEVNFEASWLCTSAGCLQGNQIYNNGWFRNDIMSQESGVQNTQEVLATGQNYWGQSDSWPQVKWLTSDYNLCQIDPNEPKCSGGGGCVAFGTPILTPTGYVPVQKLVPGETVDEYSFATQSIVSGQLVSANSTGVTQLVDLNHGLLYLTPTDQPVYIGNSTFVGWIHDPRNIVTGDNLFDPVTGTWIPVTSVELVNHSSLVYDVVTSGWNNYIANGALLDIKV